MIPSFKAPMRRMLVTSLVMLIVLFAAAVPASAKPGGQGSKPGGTGASITLNASEWYPNTPCAFDATYTWAGSKGSAASGSVSLFDQSGHALAVAPQVVSLPASGSFTYIFTFTGSGGTPRGIYSRGVLLRSGVEVAGSVATSPVISSTCDGPISIGWVQTIPIT